MTILLFSLLERFAVYDNKEDCARQQLKICPVICITFLSIQKKRMWLMTHPLSSVMMRAIPAFCFGIQ